MHDYESERVASVRWGQRKRGAGKNGGRGRGGEKKRKERWTKGS